MKIFELVFQRRNEFYFNLIPNHSSLRGKGHIVPTSFEYAVPTQAPVGSHEFQKYNPKIFWDLQKIPNRLFPRLLSNFYRTRVRSLAMLVTHSLTDQLTKLNFCSDFEHKVWSRF